MRQDARMLAALLGRSMGLGEAWEVSGTWFEEVEGGPDELHVRVARRRGHAVPCPECGVPCGVHDTRERTWRHLDIWQLFWFNKNCAEIALIFGQRTRRFPCGIRIA